MNQKIVGFCASWLRKEKDPEKLIDHITKINQALEELHEKSRHPLNANAYLYSIAPVLSQPPQYDC
jgi:hypothetical protein